MFGWLKRKKKKPEFKGTKSAWLEIHGKTVRLIQIDEKRGRNGSKRFCALKEIPKEALKSKEWKGYPIFKGKRRG